MTKKYSRKWRSSKKPSKQRKYQKNAPLHIRHHFLRVHLSKELREKYGRRSFRVVKGDKVKVMRGTYKGKVAKVEKVDTKKLKVYLEGVMYEKKDGSKVKVAFSPSNLMILELNLEDKRRRERLQKKLQKELLKKGTEKNGKSVKNKSSKEEEKENHQKLRKEEKKDKEETQRKGEI